MPTKKVVGVKQLLTAVDSNGEKSWFGHLASFSMNSMDWITSASLSLDHTQLQQAQSGLLGQLQSIAKKL